MKKIIKAFGILFLAALSLSCSNLFDEEKYGSVNVPEDDVSIYNQDFISTKYYHAIDVTAAYSSYYGSILINDNGLPYAAEGRTKDADWTNGSYVTFEKNEENYTWERNNRNYVFPTFTATLNTRKSNGTYVKKVLGYDLKIIYIGEDGFITHSGELQDEDNYLAAQKTHNTLFYTKKGWEDYSKNETPPKDGDFYKYTWPTYESILDFADSRTKATISFASTTVSKTTTDSAFTNTITNTGDGIVTYSSSDTSVAEVNETTGEVTIKGKGTCTITANAQDSETNKYTTKTATYTLTVVEIPVDDYEETETYHTDFTSTRFYYVKDVQRSGENSTSVVIKNPKNPYVTTSLLGAATSDDDWTEGSYVTLTNNNITENYGGKTIPTYTSTLYTKQSNGTYKQLVLGRNVKIIGIGEFGFFTISGTNYGTFYYTKKGWNASYNGTNSLTVNYAVSTPTYEEVLAYLSNNSNNN
ncbi:MAG: Ig-like domain-containing protein [Treponema sp.]|nr:Ig-like domain-containing protein [Treponema sp.]